MRFLAMLWKCLWVWKIKPATEEELQKCHVVLALSTGRLRDGLPGPGEKATARVIRELHALYGLPTIVQEDVAMAAPGFPFLEVARGERGQWKSSQEWNTAVIMDWAAGICRRRGWHRLVIAATPDHLGRAIWVAERRGLTAAAAPMPERRKYFDQHYGVWYCRGAFRFRVREFLVRVFFLLRGDI